MNVLARQIVNMRLKFTISRLIQCQQGKTMGVGAEMFYSIELFHCGGYSPPQGKKSVGQSCLQIMC